MTYLEKVKSIAQFAQEDKRLVPQGVDSASDEFLRAFCELMEIGTDRKGEPVVVLPPNPNSLH